MAWITKQAPIGHQPITTNSTVQNHPLGTRIEAWDDSASSQGMGEFIYLLGVSGTLVGLVVKYNATTYQTVLITATAVQAVPVAVAMSACVGSEYGWYQVAGTAVVKKTAVVVTPQVTLFISGTSGRVKVVASAGLQLVGARSANLGTISGAVSTVLVTINNPHLQSQIT